MKNKNNSGTFTIGNKRAIPEYFDSIKLCYKAANFLNVSTNACVRCDSQGFVPQWVLVNANAGIRIDNQFQ